MIAIAYFQGRKEVHAPFRRPRPTVVVRVETIPISFRLCSTTTTTSEEIRLRRSRVRWMAPPLPRLREAVAAAVAEEGEEEEAGEDGVNRK